MPQYCHLSDPGMEDMPCEVESVRQCVGLRQLESLPDETSILYCQHLREKHEWSTVLCEMIHSFLAA